MLLATSSERKEGKMRGGAGEAEEPGSPFTPPDQKAPEAPATSVNSTAEPPGAGPGTRHPEEGPRHGRMHTLLKTDTQTSLRRLSPRIRKCQNWKVA